MNPSKEAVALSFINCLPPRTPVPFVQQEGSCCSAPTPSNLWSSFWSSLVRRFISSSFFLPSHLFLNFLGYNSQQNSFPTPGDAPSLWRETDIQTSIDHTECWDSGSTEEVCTNPEVEGREGLLEEVKFTWEGSLEEVIFILETFLEEVIFILESSLPHSPREEMIFTWERCIGRIWGEYPRQTWGQETA